jgi:hypothetical protein
MVELLLSMAILSLMIVGLAELFSFAANSWSGQMRRSAQSGDLEETAALLRKDLESAFANRPCPDQTFDPSELTNEAQRHFIAGKTLLPFEIDRRSGLGLKRSFQNADPSRRFSQIAFVAVQPGAGSLLPENFYRERHGHLANPALPAGARPTPSDISLIGYYVAYTPDSLAGGNDRWSMKLYRHFRPGGTSLGQAQASSTVRSVTGKVNHDLVPRLKFRNSELPFLLAFHTKDLEPAVNAQTSSQPPWPASLPALGRPLPDRSRAAHWFRPNHPLHDVLPGDQALADRVVAFSATPYKRVLNGDKPVVLGAADLAKQLGFSSDDWPVLVAPDFIDIELAVVDENTAALLTKRDDWLVDWRGSPVARESPAARLIRESVTSLRFRVTLHSVPGALISS